MLLEIAAVIAAIGLPIAWVLAYKARYESPQRLHAIEIKIAELVATVEEHQKLIGEGRIKDIQADLRDIKLGGSLGARTGRHL